MRIDARKVARARSNRRNRRHLDAGSERVRRAARRCTTLRAPIRGAQASSDELPPVQGVVGFRTGRYHRLWKIRGRDSSSHGQTRQRVLAAAPIQSWARLPFPPPRCLESVFCSLDPQSHHSRGLLIFSRPGLQPQSSASVRQKITRMSCSSGARALGRRMEIQQKPLGAESSEEERPSWFIGEGPGPENGARTRWGAGELPVNDRFPGC